MNVPQQEGHDYLFKISVKNNKIIALMKSHGVQCSRQLIKKLGYDERHTKYAQLNSIISMRDSPINKRTKEFKAIVLEIAIYFNVKPEDLFNEQQLYDPMEQNVIEYTCNAEKFQAIAQGMLARLPAPQDIDDIDLTSKMLESLSERSKDILVRSIQEGETLEEIADSYELSRDRVRQIREKALSTIRRKFSGEIYDN